MVGLDKLGALIEGGIPDATSVVLCGSPGTGKTTLALQLVHDHVRAGGAAIFVSTESSPAQVLKLASLRGLALQADVGDGLHFLDAYSWRASKPADGPGIVSVGALNDLSGLSIRLTELMERRKPERSLLVVLDSPSTLTLHAPPASILKFLEVVFAKVKGASGSVLALVEKEMHEEPFRAALSAMADGELDFRIVEENDDLVRMMRVQAMRTAPGVSSKWVRLGLTKEGLSLLAAPQASKA